jgi:transcriptional regulator with XRE-family HTH domain
MKTVGDRIRELRLDTGMTQLELAEAVRQINPEFSGAQSTIQAIEGGKSKKPTILYELSKVFGVTVEYIKTGSSAPAKAHADEESRLRDENKMLRQMLRNLL